MTDQNNTSWKGPFGIIAAPEIYQVPARDGVNWVDRDGIETELRNGGAPLMDEQTYLKRYGTLVNGAYHYIPGPINCCGGMGNKPDCCK